MVRTRKAAKKSMMNGRLNTPKQSSSQSSREPSPAPTFQNQGVQTDRYLNFSNIIKFVLVTLICGMTFSQIKDFSIINETDSCSEKVFYEYQDIITDSIIELARESTQKYSENLNDDTIVSIDVAWDHRRHGSACIVTMIDIQSRKIIDSSIRQKRSNLFLEILKKILGI
ncbi:hypothetical protein M9Y10_039626 [Tritrichomonas musculus]|uniref:Uncharacterized protein n=1 Tax=Tritrichomonas musculus TaxID=1915356 RepID=A0ABR2GRV5_9EUKA